LLGTCPTSEEDFDLPDLLPDLGVVEGVLVAGVEIVGDVDVTGAPGEATLITCAGAVDVFALDPARPMSTPTPIASNSTPTPAMTAVGPPLRAGAAAMALAPIFVAGEAAHPPTSAAAAGATPAECEPVARGLEGAGGAPSGAAATCARRVPHSKQ